MVSRILLVDDEHEFIELIEYRLGDRSYEFIEARDGVDALNKARKFLPDLILLDILLPDLDGLSVCEILQRQPSTKQIPVILMSALSGNITSRVASAHAEDFFSKPLDLEKLEARIKSVLKRDASEPEDAHTLSE